MDRAGQRRGLVEPGGITQAGTAPNTITFDNQSGEAALVKVVGPLSQAVTVPNGHHATVHAAVGEGEDPRGEGHGAGNGLAAAAPGPENPEPSAGLPKTITGRDGAPMVLVPDGAFWMGTSHD